MVLFLVLFLNFFFVKDGWTPLHIAAENGFEEVVEILVEHGSNMNIQTKVLIFLFLLSFKSIVRFAFFKKNSFLRMAGLLFTLALSKVLKKLCKFLLNMDPT